MTDRERRPSEYRVVVDGLRLELRPHEPGFVSIAVTLSPEQAASLAYELERNVLIALAAGHLALGELEALTQVNHDA